MSLNPCFNGRYSQRVLQTISIKISCSLNPCFNGRYSQSPKLIINHKKQRVLILVLMEDTLREQRLMFFYISVFGVCSSF